MPEEGALLWYYFIVQYQGNTVYYGNNKEQLGGVGAVYTQEPPSYQITVYDKDVHTPDWFKNAIVYQIFPDRFCRSESSTAKLFGKKGAVIHSDWNDIPHYCKDNQGNVVQYDFFGGNLAGIRKKLDYLKMLHERANYLVGENNIGKSSFLRLLSLISSGFGILEHEPLLLPRSLQANLFAMQVVV